MDYDEINSMLSRLETEETGIENEEVKKVVSIEDKNKINSILCFRDINHKKNLENKHLNQKNVENNIDTNKQIIDRIFKQDQPYKPHPIMELYPQSSRNINKNKNKVSN